MLNKKELSNKLINNEKVEVFNPIWENFHQETIISDSMTEKEYKNINYMLYEDMILYKYTNGENKQHIKNWIIEKFNMIKDYKNFDKFDVIMLEVFTDLLNKYFSIQNEEKSIGILNNQKVNYSWNKVLSYILIPPNGAVDYYQLQIKVLDWINHKINNKYSKKFGVDEIGRIYL